MVSIIIPTLNEVAALPSTLAAVEKAAAGQVFEVVVADAGSTDGTVEVAAALGYLCIPSPRVQRAAQMNAGAARARGTILLFLHADTLLAPGALASVEATCGQPGVAGGGFARRYHSPSLWLRLTCVLAQWRNRCVGWHLGDQAIFVRRPVFEQLGGFSDFDVFEDVDFSRRLARAGMVRTLYPPVVSSARRFARDGAFRRSLADAWLMLRYLLGASPHLLVHARVDGSATVPDESLVPRPVVPGMQPVRRGAENVEE